jgi:nucleoid-associated protein YgaU
VTRESKLALMIAVTLILLVGVLLSDHLSGATVAEFDEPAPSDRVVSPVAGLPGADDPIASLVAKAESGPTPDGSTAGLFEVLDQSGPNGLNKPVVISQGGQSPERSILGQALDGVGTGVEGAVGRLRASDPPVLIAWAEQFEPVSERSVTLPPRDPRGDSPVKPVPDEPTVRTRDATGFVPSGFEPTRAWRTHTVVSGDNLYRLATRHLGDGERWLELQRLNRDLLDGGSELQIGQVIKIAPITGGQAAPVTRTVTPTVTRKERAAKPSPVVREYVVLKGDMLSEISLKLLGTTRRMKEIVELNGLNDPNDIRVGQTLKIPAR